MKALITLLAVVLTIFPDCGDDLVDYSQVSATFRLTDTLGVVARQFKSGESFDLSFTVDNNSRHTLTYTSAPPDIVFEIRQLDSVIARSSDYFVYIQVIDQARVESHSSLNFQWRGPSTTARPVALVLAPGEYIAVVRHQCMFNEFRLTEQMPISFTVVP